MEELKKDLILALNEFKRQNGKDAELEEGDWFVAEFNNGTMIFSLKDGNIDVKFSANKPIKVDCKFGYYNECGAEEK